jgi:hypothetical protein
VVDADALRPAAAAPGAAAAAAAAAAPSPAASSAGGRAPPPRGAAPEGLQAVLEHAGRSEPLFLLFRNGTLKARVAGANLPKLAALVYEHTPNNPEVDDAEVRVLWPLLGHASTGFWGRAHWVLLVWRR